MERLAGPSLNTIAIFVLGLLTPFVIYFSTARSLVEIWNSSETYAHGYIILPVSLWLIWRKRALLAAAPIQPFWPGLPLIGLTGIVWTLSELGDVQVIRQYSFVTMIVLTILTLAGRHMFKVILFPLCFLFLAVPFGDIFIAPLIDFTANFTVMALQLSGIPVWRNGTSFSLPSGNWTVVEACSGVRYLISSFTLGCLYAYLTYRQWQKRLLLILAALIIPVIANGLRAYLIVMLGHLSSMTLAVGVDHLIYGWLFFGLVMYLLFWVGNFWRDDLAAGPDQPPESTAPVSSTHWASSQSSLQSLLACTVCIVLCLTLFPLTAQTVERANYNTATVNLQPFHSSWQQVDSVVDWQPHYLPAEAELMRSYVKDNYRVQLNIKFYRNQSHASELISSSNKMKADDDTSWSNNTQSSRSEEIMVANADRPLRLSIRETQLSDASGHLLIWSLDWVNGQFNNNHVAGKIIQTWNKLRLRGDDAAAVIISVPFPGNPDEARQILRAYLSADFSAIRTLLDANRKH